MTAFHKCRYGNERLPAPPLIPKESGGGRGMKILRYSSAFLALILLACPDPSTSPQNRKHRAKDFDTLKAAGNTSPFGIWSDGTTMWVADYPFLLRGSPKIYAYSMSNKARESAKNFDTLGAAGNTSPFGIWSDGTTMWVADSADEKIYAYSIATKARDRAKDFDTLKAAGNRHPSVMP